MTVPLVLNQESLPFTTAAVAAVAAAATVTV
jgi:hypothetical protein